VPANADGGGVPLRRGESELRVLPIAAYGVDGALLQQGRARADTVVIPRLELIAAAELQHAPGAEPLFELGGAEADVLADAQAGQASVACHLQDGVARDAAEEPSGLVGVEQRAVERHAW